MSSRDRRRLRDILTAVDSIERYTSAGRVSFEASEPIRSHVLLQLQIIGEATASLNTVFREQHPNVPWRRIIALRNLLVHQYWHVDDERVWRITQENLPQLRTSIEQILADE